MQQALGQVFVLADGFSHSAGRIDLGRLDAALLGTPAKLHQAAAGEAAIRNATGHGGLDDGARAGAQALVFVQLAQVGHGFVGVEAAVTQGGLDELLRIFKRLAAHGLFAVFDHHLVHAGVCGGRGAGKSHGAASLGLQGQGSGLQHMRQRDVAIAPLGVQHANGRKQGAQAVFKAGHLADGALGFGTGHHGLDGHVAAPEVGATQGPGAGYIHGNSLFYVPSVRRALECHRVQQKGVWRLSACSACSRPRGECQRGLAARARRS